MTTTTQLAYRVTCLEWISFTLGSEDAARAVDRMADQFHPDHLHTIEVDDGNGWTPLYLWRAGQILAAPLMSQINVGDGTLTKVVGGWSAETAAKADQVAPEASGAWYEALGRHEHATLTADGRGAVTDLWCTCQPSPDPDGWVRYQRYTAKGLAGHGFVCGSCRRIIQSG